LGEGRIVREAAPKEGTEQAPAKEEGEATASTLEARLTAVADEYSDVNGPVVEAIQAMRAEIAALKPSAQRDEAPVSDADVEAIAVAYDTLAQSHPDYEQHGPGSAFDTWWKTQPDPVKGLANSFDPAEVSLALSLYKAQAGLTRAVAEDPGKRDGTASDRRARQLEGSRDTPSRGAPVAAGVPDDFSAAFNARVKAKAVT
jgi:hypothetical protein